MPPPFENVLRDQIAANLGLIEPGLELLGVESPLTNPVGTGARVDILAKDTFGNRVIIELKRSDQSARDAIHEIHKYVALFRTQHGLPTSRIRCVIASTTWKELLVPFSEFVASASHQVEGRQIEVDESGRVIGSKLVTPITLSEGIKYFHAHSVYLYSDRNRRDAMLKEMAEKLSSTTSLGFLLIEVDRERPHDRIIYPHGIYLVFARFDLETEATLRAQYCSIYEYESNDVETVLFDDHCLADIMSSIDIEFDSLEIGNAEKLHTILRTGWQVGSVHRFGDVQTPLAATDHELIDRISGHEGENVGFFIRTTKPSFQLDWADITESGKKSLVGNANWTKGYEWFCGAVEKDYPNSTVAIKTYNPLNLPITLYKYRASCDLRYVPSMELFVSDDLANRTLLLLGDILWDGKTHPTIDSVFARFDDGLWGFLSENHFNSAWERDQELMKAHGLRYVLRSVTVPETPSVNFEEQDGSLITMPRPSQELRLHHFISANITYLFNLMREMRRIQIGL